MEGALLHVPLTRATGGGADYVSGRHEWAGAVRVDRELEDLVRWTEVREADEGGREEAVPMTLPYARL